MAKLLQYPTTVDANFKTVRYEVVDETVFHRRAFKNYLEGKSGFLIRTTKEFYELFYISKHYPICFFNMNYSDDFPLYWDDNNDGFYGPSGVDQYKNFMSIAVNKFLPNDVVTWDETGKFTFPLEVWLEPLESADPSEISREWTNAVTRLMGEMVMPYAKIARMTTLRYFNQYAGHEEKNGSTVVFDSIEHSPLIRHNEKDKLAYFTFFDFNPELNGTWPLVRMIEAHRNYSLLLNNLRAEWLNWIDAYSKEVVEIQGETHSYNHGRREAIYTGKDESVHSKMTAILLWLSRNNSDQYLVELQTEEAYVHLREIATLFAITPTVYAPMTPRGGRYLILDSDGSLQCMPSKGVIGFIEISKCDEVINVLYEIIVTCIRIKRWEPTLASFNVLRTCHYPFMDNVPGFFWNGDIFDPPSPDQIPRGEYEKEQDKETGDGSFDFSGAIFTQDSSPTDKTGGRIELRRVYYDGNEATYQCEKRRWLEFRESERAFISTERTNSESEAKIYATEDGKEEGPLWIDESTWEGFLDDISRNAGCGFVV